eukprot:5651662-Pyramimonas_sp.AAC.2
MQSLRSASSRLDHFSNAFQELSRVRWSKNSGVCKSSPNKGCNGPAECTLLGRISLFRHVIDRCIVYTVKLCDARGAPRPCQP